MGIPSASMTIDDGLIPEPLNENDHVITVRKCSVSRQKLIPVDESKTLNIKEAVALLAPTKTRQARANVLKLKTGQYIGVKSGDSSNFVIMNPTTDGDIRWLLRKQPDLDLLSRDIYLVESVTIRRNAIDLPSDGAGNGDRT